MEQFSIPGAGGIIVKRINGEKNILIQTRVKPHALHEDGLLEIPAGKIRAFESIFDTLKREIKEETGLDVVEVLGENQSTVFEGNSYKVINFMPYSCSQNLIGNYPITRYTWCTDCGAKYGHYHHDGCDCEICPVCNGQLLTCGCKVKTAYIEAQIKSN